MTLIKNLKEIQKIRIASQMAANTIKMIEPYIKLGITTNYLNKICHYYILNKLKAVPSPLNYKRFPKSICTSINYVVCHGIPDNKKLKNNDIINIDITINKDGFHGDTSKMFFVGKINSETKNLIIISQKCMYLGIKKIKPGINLNKIGSIIESYAVKNKKNTVRNFCGHGIGKNFHEKPYVFHYKTEEDNCVLKAGMIFTVEPMINYGKHFVRILSDKWTVITKDKMMSAQWEHTVLVTNTGYEILTYREEEYLIKKKL